MPNVRKGMTPERAKRAAKVVELHDQGLTFADIGAQLGLSKTTVHEDYEKAMAEAIPETAKKVFRKMDRRLERLHAAYWHLAIEGDYKAARLILDINERLSRLWGVDGAVKVEVATGGTDFAELLESIRATAESDPLGDDDLEGRPNLGK